MQKICFIFLFFYILHSNAKIIQAKKNDSDNNKESRNLLQMMGNNFVAPPLVSPPPPIFSSGRLPVQKVYNLIHFPHQYSSPLVDYAYPTVFNPYYNHMLPYGLSSMFANPHIMSSLGMYGANPYSMSMLHNGFFGMVPYQNSQISGMTGINNSAQNWDHQDA